MENENLEQYRKFKNSIERYRQISIAEEGFSSSSLDVEYNDLMMEEQTKLRKFLDELSIVDLGAILGVLRNDVKEVKLKKKFLKEQIDGPKNFYKKIFKRQEIRDIKRTITHVDFDLRGLDREIIEIEFKVDAKFNAGEKVNKSEYQPEAEKITEIQPEQ
jgi:hypothetical protein